MSDNTFDDGGHSYQYRVGNELQTITVPPVDFSPLLATGADLARYGIPERPSDAAGLADWKLLVGSWKRNPETSLCVGTEFKYGRMKSAAAPITYSVSSQNWSGYVADAGSLSSNYESAQARFVHPSLHSPYCTPNENGSWVGVGGLHSGRLVQDGTEMSTNRSWYEYLGNNNTGIPPVYLFNVSAGDTIYAYTTIDPSTGLTNFYIQDETSGVYRSVSVTLNVANYYDGSATDYINEEPTGFNLRNFSSIKWTSAQAQKTDGSWNSLGSQNERKVILSVGGFTDAEPGDMTSTQAFYNYYYHC